MSKLGQLPRRFCWTKFGTEAGQTIEEILARKDQERAASNGIFLWGIGNSVGPGIRQLVLTEDNPCVVFSPMLSKAKAIDVSPAATVQWTRAVDLSGNDWPLPEAARVLSRAGSGMGRAKLAHYALVCHSESSLLNASPIGEIQYDSLSNLVSGAKLGHSQVTSVVSRSDIDDDSVRGPTYIAQMAVHLVYPYFVRLLSPLDLSAESLNSARSHVPSKCMQLAL